MCITGSADHDQGPFRFDWSRSDGENLVLNAESNGFSSVVYNRTYAKTEEFPKGRGAGRNIQGATDLQDFVNQLERPRRILMMVKAGGPVDAVIEQISPA